MGKVVGAFATSHILMGSPEGDEAAQRIVKGLDDIGARIRALEPDVVYLISSDHLFNINLKLQPPFTVGIADSYTPLGDMDIPRNPIKGHRAAGHSLCKRAYASGFDPAMMEELNPDHGIMVPMMYINGGEADIPLVPILVNINMDPPPTAQRCFGFGTALKDCITHDLPDDMRVVVVGTGGLSHWINIERHGEVDAEADKAILELFKARELETIAAMSTEEILGKLGNGGLETCNWLMAAATADALDPEVIYYEAMPHWLTGMGGMAFTR
ncbi:MAG: AmmeMemoRadiSam system protein B [Pseudomonadota bacterium]